jgi:hypothetical protein
MKQKVIINKIEDASQQYVINNIAYNTKVYIACCPKCGKQLIKFPPNMNYGDILDYLNYNKDKLNESYKYCSGCAQELMYEQDVIDNKD